VLAGDIASGETDHDVHANTDPFTHRNSHGNLNTDLYTYGH
jgi:hypothetical protein